MNNVNINKGTENMKNHHKEITALMNTITKLKNSVEELNSKQIKQKKV